MVRATGSPTNSDLDLAETPYLESEGTSEDSPRRGVTRAQEEELQLPQIGKRTKVVTPPPLKPRREVRLAEEVRVSTSPLKSPSISGPTRLCCTPPKEKMGGAFLRSNTEPTGLLRAAARDRNSEEHSMSSSYAGKLGVDPMHHEHQSAAALCAAAADGDADVLMALLESGHPAGKGDYDRRTPLHLASEEGHLECVQLLIEHGADINCCDRWGTTPLKGALHNLHNEVANYLRDMGAKIGGAQLDLTQNKRKCRQWFERVLRYSGLPADSNVIPTVALAAYLLTEHGIDIARHTQLQSELTAMKRRPRELEGKTPYAKEVREWLNAGAKYVKHLVGMKKYTATEPPTKERKQSRRDTELRPRSAGQKSSKTRDSFSGLQHAFDPHPTSMTEHEATFPLHRRPSADDGRTTATVDTSLLRVPLTHPMLSVERGVTHAKANIHLGIFGKSVVEFKDLLRAALGEDVPDDDKLTKATKKSSPGWRPPPTGRTIVSVPAPALQKVVLGRLQINNWPSFVDSVLDIAASVLYGPNEGSLPTTIPALAQQDPEVFAVAVTTVDGQQLEIGDRSPFTQQSAGMPFLYAATIEDYGEQVVHSYIGQEPTGRSVGHDFDFALTTAGKPFNAVTSAGAVVTASLYHPDETVQDRTVRFLGVMRKLSGQDIPPVDEKVFSSEEGTSYRNHAIASFMMAEGCFARRCKSIQDYLDHVSFYHRTCAAQNTSQGLASEAATLANYGTNPLTSDRCFSFSTVKLTLQLAYSCGMRGSAGEWACTVGIPAKSGLAGAIWLCVPGVLGLCVRSPKLDSAGNSKRGVMFSKRFADRFQWGVMDLLYKARDAGTDA
eukprot:Hpha_TRINITY_DN14009_c0_g1::TRINITY_DN14009_c0_g1_i1::g.44313::m.44313/K01425/glsA, GLS; glutaminase